MKKGKMKKRKKTREKMNTLRQHSDISPFEKSSS
jgi:hypothetical protein